MTGPILLARRSSCFFRHLPILERAWWNRAC